MPKLICEFRRINPEQFLARTEMAQAPEQNELINIDGDPYIVIDRKWAIATTNPELTFCYLAVVRYK